MSALNGERVTYVSIDTAPKDGRKIQAINMGHVAQGGTLRWSDDVGCWVSAVTGHTPSWKPTHWAPNFFK